MLVSLGFCLPTKWNTYPQHCMQSEAPTLGVWLMCDYSDNRSPLNQSETYKFSLIWLISQLKREKQFPLLEDYCSSTSRKCVRQQQSPGLSRVWRLVSSGAGRSTCFCEKQRARAEAQLRHAHLWRHLPIGAPRVRWFHRHEKPAGGVWLLASSHQARQTALRRTGGDKSKACTFSFTSPDT